MRRHLSSIVLVLALSAGACTSGSTDDAAPSTDSTSSVSTTTPTTPAPTAAAGPTPEPITVVGPIGGGTPVGDALVAELAAFTTENGVEVIYDPNLDIADMVDRVTGPDPPDLIISPQPGTLIELAPALVDLTGFVDPVALRREFGDYLIDVVTVEGAVLGGPIKLDLKSMVWYKPAAFEAEGYAVPRDFCRFGVAERRDGGLWVDPVV